MFVFSVNHITISTDLFTRIINILLMIRAKLCFCLCFRKQVQHDYIVFQVTVCTRLRMRTWLPSCAWESLCMTTHSELTMSFCTNWWMIASERIFMGLTVYTAPLDHISLRENAGSCTYPRISNCVRIWVQLIRFIILRLFWRHLFALRADNR